MSVKYATFDYSGEFRGDLIYKLEVLTDLGYELDYKDPEKHPGAIIAPRNTTAMSVYTEAWDRSEALYECPENKEHQTGKREIEFLVDAFGGDFVPDLIHDHYNIELLTSLRLSERIENSGLTGFSAERVPIRVNQSRVPDLQLARATFHGAPCDRRRKTHVPPADQNRCPDCGTGPVVCPGCNDVMRTCTGCGRELTGRKARLGKPGIEASFVADKLPFQRRVIDGNRWDGSDFIDFSNIGFVTRRAVDFLRAIRATAFVAKPCDVDVSKMSTTHLRQLERRYSSE